MTTIIPFYSHSRGPYRCFSQFYPCKFTLDGITFNCAEQWMMYQKAMLFTGNEKLAEQILAHTDPAKIKACGRKVKDFNGAVWDGLRELIVHKGNLAKFSQNKELAKVLVNTGNAILVEASANDSIWGVGLDASNPDIYDQDKWQGLNLLGKVLMNVRDSIATGS